MEATPPIVLDVTLTSPLLDHLIEYFDARIEERLDPENLHATRDRIKAENELRNVEQRPAEIWRSAWTDCPEGGVDQPTRPVIVFWGSGRVTVSKYCNRGDGRRGEWSNNPGCDVPTWWTELPNPEGGL